MFRMRALLIAVPRRIRQSDWTTGFEKYHAWRDRSLAVAPGRRHATSSDGHRSLQHGDRWSCAGESEGRGMRRPGVVESMCAVLNFIGTVEGKDGRMLDEQKAVRNACVGCYEFSRRG